MNTKTSQSEQGSLTMPVGETPMTPKKLAITWKLANVSSNVVYFVDLEDTRFPINAPLARALARNGYAHFLTVKIKGQSNERLE